MEFLSRHPSLRLLLPMMAGIVCGEWMWNTKWASWVLPIFIAAAVVCCLAYRRYRTVVFGAGTFLFFMCLGFLRTASELQVSAAAFPDERVACQVFLTDIPREKANSMQCLAALETVWTDDGGVDSPDNKQLILYVAKDSLAMQLKRGDRLWVYTRLETPVENHLPDAFDYARYLRHRGICGTAYVAADNWQLKGHQDVWSVSALAQDCRAEVKKLYQTLGFQEHELAVLSALTTGDKDELDEEIKETYSVAGASHVLAISGMHVGLVYSMLWFLLSPCWKRVRSLKLPLYAFILCVLWAFALFTGFSTSVIRAVWMCSFFLVFSLRLEPVSSMDTLLAVAFFMLLFKPLWLFDVGCQLSFAAVLAILFLYQPIYSLLSVRHRLLRKVWGIVSVSIAAQIGTAPLVMFYFSRFSTHFLITNVWVIPLVTLVMYMAVAMWALFPFPGLQAKVASLLDGLLHLQNEGLRRIEQLPLASVDGISMNLWDVCFCYVSMMLAWVMYRRAVFSNILYFLSVCMLWAVWHGASVYHHLPRAGITFYSANGCTAVHCSTNHAQSWLVSADSLPRVSSLNRLLTPHWNRLHLDTPHCIQGDYASDALSVSRQILCYRGKKVCILSDNRWLHHTAPRPLPVDFLLVSHSYRGGIRHLQSLFAIHTVVVDEALPAYYKNLIRADCASMGVSCVWLKERGRLEYPL